MCFSFNYLMNSLVRLPDPSGEPIGDEVHATDDLQMFAARLSLQDYEGTHRGGDKGEAQRQIQRRLGVRELFLAARQRKGLVLHLDARVLRAMKPMLQVL